MEIVGHYRIEASREKVWNRLLDPEVLRSCIPGCRQLSVNDVDSYDATVKLKLGPVSATFAATVEINDIEAPRRCRLVGKSNDRIAGFAKGECVVDLQEVEGSTSLTYRATTEIGGKICVLGSRLIQATSRKLADQFFAEFARLLSRV